MTQTARANVQYYLQLVQTLLLAVFVPLCGWFALEVIEQGKQIAIAQSERESIAKRLDLMDAAGKPYYTEDAKEDFGVIMPLIQDHELRLRAQEARRHQ